MTQGLDESLGYDSVPLNEDITGSGRRLKEKGVGKETKNQTIPFPLFLIPKSFSNQTWE